MSWDAHVETKPGRGQTMERQACKFRNIKDSWQPLETRRGPSLRPWRVRRWHPDVDFWPSELWGKKSVVLSNPGGGTLLRQPWELIWSLTAIFPLTVREPVGRKRPLINLGPRFIIQWFPRWSPQLNHMPHVSLCVWGETCGSLGNGEEGETSSQVWFGIFGISKCCPQRFNMLVYTTGHYMCVHICIFTNIKKNFWVQFLFCFISPDNYSKNKGSMWLSDKTDTSP